MAIMISLVLPSISIKVAVELPEMASAIPTALPDGIDQKESFELLPPVKEEINWLLITQYLYFFISISLIVKLIRSIILILGRAKRNSYKIGNYLYVQDETASGSSSFFNIIILNKGHKDQGQIIAHEQTHSRLLHSVDHLFAELASAFLWFNPVIHFIKKDLYQIHEYEVDRCLTQKYEVNSYAELLLRLATSSKLTLENGFSTIGVRSRIEMLFKHPSTRQERFLYILILPVFFCLTYFFSVENTFASPTLPNGFVMIIDAGHGGKDAGGISKTGHQEKDITLQMANVIQSLARTKGITTVMTRGTDEFVRLRDRAGIKGSILISLHMKTGTGNAFVNGFEIGYSTESSESHQSQRLAQITKKHLESISQMETLEALVNANILVLRENLSPGIVIQMGDSNYPGDLNYMLDKQNQMELAGKILEAVQEYGAK